jgi:hypothetical protein
MDFRHVLLLTALALHAESIAGLQWTAPAGWTNKGTAPMRAATYSVPATTGDTQPAECVVYFFGKGQGGPVDANIDRWKSQFTGAGGKPAPAKVGMRTLNGLPATTLDVTGNYSGMGGPLADSKSIAANYRLLGAILVNPEGNIFIKFTGPSKTVAANQPKFEQLLNSFRRP